MNDKLSSASSRTDTPSDHNRHLLAQLIVTNFYQFIGELSDHQLVQIAYLTVAKIPKIKRELLVFYRCAGQGLNYKNIRNHADVNPSWVISELRDIIRTGFNGMNTIRRVDKLNLFHDDGLDNEDFIAGMKRHLKTREKLMEESKFKAPSYEQELNNYVSTNCGLDATANSVLIVGEFFISCFRSRKIKFFL